MDLQKKLTTLKQQQAKIQQRLEKQKLAGDQVAAEIFKVLIIKSPNLQIHLRTEQIINALPKKNRSTFLQWLDQAMAAKPATTPDNQKFEDNKDAGSVCQDNKGENPQNENGPGE